MLAKKPLMSAKVARLFRVIISGYAKSTRFCKYLPFSIKGTMKPNLRARKHGCTASAGTGNHCFSPISDYIAPQRVRVPGPWPGLLLEGLPQRVFRRGRTDGT
jgi:hypothetical protein